MKLVTYDSGSGAQIGLLFDDTVIAAREILPSLPNDMTALLQAGLAPLARAAAGKLPRGPEPAATLPRSRFAV